MPKNQCHLKKKSLWVLSALGTLHLNFFQKTLIFALEATSALSCQNELFPRFSSLCDCWPCSAQSATTCFLSPHICLQFDHMFVYIIFSGKRMCSGFRTDHTDQTDTDYLFSHLSHWELWKKESFYITHISLIRVVLMQSCAAGAKYFTNYVFCHPQSSGVISKILKIVVPLKKIF